MECSSTTDLRDHAAGGCGRQSDQLVLGKHSGRHALRSRLAEMGHSLDDVELDKAFTRFKELADRKKVITDADLEALIADEFYQPRDVYFLDGLQVSCGTMGMPTATVRLRGPDRSVHVFASMGTGPVDATYKAIDAIVKCRASCSSSTFMPSPKASMLWEK